jgi:hypothetical protein
MPGVLRKESNIKACLIIHIQRVMNVFNLNFQRHSVLDHVVCSALLRRMTVFVCVCVAHVKCVTREMTFGTTNIMKTTKKSARNANIFR